ncbi:carbohydrate-binding domain-containing protein [Hyalangium rubrum]|uniref:Carbohydrate-binding domain-containing protein n=1 Tax=Hyalangium rubrum TaxID=3103134 RepID=A0ABU5H3C8_9BACT|nr:carbohydrate-binding domain-containing protein [Hyalangium sp. s54d21]MDY7227816.1 carbohydrate-binding domain-containing protein [Hyalangium sp. s54d21]
MEASSQARRYVLLVTAIAAAGASGCYGQATLEVPGYEVPTRDGVPVYDGDNPPLPVLEQDGSIVCASASAPDTVTLASIAADFERQVQPAMLNESSGCISCHATTSGRLFKVSPNGVETFYAARAAGYLRTSAGSLLSRLITTDESARMPRGQPSWNARELAALASLTCQLAAVEARSPQTPPDEEFPPALLQPYSGPPVASYDNPFLNFVQLKGKVKLVFNDSWVRNNVDKFAQRVGLFGGVDYEQYFVEARVATPDFLLGLDELALDVCGAAATNRTGPFAGVDTSAGLVDTPAATTRTFQAENSQDLTPSTGQTAGTGWNLYTTGTLTTTQAHVIGYGGTYRFTVRARGDLCGSEPPMMELRMDGAQVQAWGVNTTAYTDFVQTVTVPAGSHVLSVGFTNDYNQEGVCDRNLYVDFLQVTGPTEPPSGTARADAAKVHVNTLYKRMLYRTATAQEQANGYALLQDLFTMEASVPKAWSGLCEGLMRSPDFLFTLPPSHETRSGLERQRLLLVKLAQDLVGRPPNAAELSAFESGSQSWEQMVETYLGSAEFRAYYFHKMRIRTESEGTADTDEPARLWTYLATTGAPMQELLTGDYSVALDFSKVPRATEHGNTGVLTMKGFIQNKPGLPRYNYAARVMTDFMGTLFEVPSEVFDMRGAATAASTVDPTSICFSCHQTLTPLSYQRMRWDDAGNYRTTDDQGRPIDDSDRGLVGVYAYKGQGMEAFAQQAVKKEPFLRRTINAQYMLFFGREMRYSLDERGMYKRLWDVAHASEGNLKAVLKAIALSPEYTHL